MAQMMQFHSMYTVDQQWTVLTGVCARVCVPVNDDLRSGLEKQNSGRTEWYTNMVCGELL